MKYLKRNIFILFFLIIICLPLTSLIFNFDFAVKLEENRVLAKTPKFDIKNISKFPKDFVIFFNDQFPLRSFLVRTNNQWKVSILNSSTNKEVTIGRGDQLFLTADLNYTETLNADFFTESELSQINKNLKEVASYLNSKNIKFYVMIAPLAQSIYPENLPVNFRKVNNTSKLDQIDKYLTSNTLIKFINPKDDLINTKAKSQLYRKYDSHWNSIGAFIVYNKLVGELSKDFPQIIPKKFNEYKITYKVSNRKDLESLLGLTNFYFETEPVLENINEQKKVNLPECAGLKIKCSFVEIEGKNKSYPKVLVYRDSFFSSLIPFFADHFSKSTYIWEQFPYSTELIEKEKPELVIFELTEREISTLTTNLFNF